MIPAYDELESLIEETTDALTYLKWLESKLEENCADVRDSYAALKDEVDTMLTNAEISKNRLEQDFYEALSDHHTFLEDYTASLTA